MAQGRFEWPIYCLGGNDERLYIYMILNEILAFYVEYQYFNQRPSRGNSYT